MESERRWPRPHFTLRAVFIILTLLCLWLGWQHEIVRARKPLLASLGGQADYSLAAMAEHRQFKSESTNLQTSSSTPSLNWFRGLLGDEPVLCIWLPVGVPSAELDRYRAAFPEATIKQGRLAQFAYVYSTWYWIQPAPKPSVALDPARPDLQKMLTIVAKSREGCPTAIGATYPCQNES